ncbi:calcium-dependent cysteine-type endopeptidase [Aureococcus anophagefferens]|nr:calcium-dependent cysteine-type endopeptidase [Aureococcus anophagefferens]
MGSAATVSSSERISAALLAADTSTVEHVRKMLAKVQSHPTEAKYRRLKTSSALFRERFVGSEDVLAVLGFVDEGELKVLPEAAAALVGDGLALVDARLAMADAEVAAKRAAAEEEKDDAAEPVAEDDAMDVDDDDLRRALELSRGGAPMEEEHKEAEAPEDGDDDDDLRRALELSRGGAPMEEEKAPPPPADDAARLARASASSSPSRSPGAPRRTSRRRSAAPQLEPAPALAPVDPAVLTPAGFQARVKALFAAEDEQRARPRRRGARGGGGGAGGRGAAAAVQGRVRAPRERGEGRRETMEVLNVMYREEGITFVDPSFPPAPSSLYAGGGNDADTWNSRATSHVKCGTCGRQHPLLEVALRPCDWLRPPDLRDDVTMLTPDVPWAVFAATSADDIRQGGVGNCWLVCALSVLADVAPWTLRDAVLTKDYNPAGAYQVRLCLAGAWHTVLVDDLFPTNALGCLAYLKAARRALWAPLVEKAAAKLHGSYEVLAGGTFAEAFHMLTGFPVQQLRLDAYTSTGGAAAKAFLEGPDMPADRLAEVRAALAEAFDGRYPGGADDAELEFFAMLYSYKESGFAVGASTFVSDGALEVEMRGLGLQTRHAYGVLDVATYDDARLVKLRNPNGVALWKGPWSRDDASRMTKDARRALGLDGEDRGVFWMAVGDFLNYFVELTVCRLLKDRLEARSSGWLASAFGSGEALLVEAYARTAVEVAAYQEPHAVRGETAQDTAVDLGVALLKCATRSDELKSEGSGAALASHALVASSPRVNHRAGARLDATLEQDDYPTTRYLVVPLCFGHLTSTEPRKYTAAIHSDGPLAVETVPLAPATVAPALAQLAVAEGRKSPLLKHPTTGAEILNIYALEDMAGYVVVAENLSELTLQTEVDASQQTRGFVSSRGALFCQDVLPPRTRQVLVILSRDAGAKRSSLGFSYNAAALDGGAPENHIPPLEDNHDNADLHAPMPLDKARPAAPAAIDAGDLAKALLGAMGGAGGGP